MDVKITHDMKLIAKAKAKKLGKLKDSILEGKGNEAGILGEIAVASLPQFSRVNTYDYDVVGVDGRKWDVKTKQRNVPIQPHYHGTVADFNTKQKCNGYIFVSVYGDTAQIVGWILRGAFYKKAKFYKEGELDPSSDLGWKFRADCYNLPYKELKPIGEATKKQVAKKRQKKK
jgi:hypothetical protein